MVNDGLNDGQWQQLLEAPPAIARAVAAVAGSGARSEMELDAFVGLLDRTAHEEAADSLLGQLASRLHASMSAGTIAAPGEDVVVEGVHSARQAGAILAVLPDEAEARAVRLWMMRVANTVAAAAREGGLLGIGAEDVSTSERDTINAIADALGVSAEPES